MLTIDELYEKAVNHKGYCAHRRYPDTLARMERAHPGIREKFTTVAQEIREGKQVAPGDIFTCDDCQNAFIAAAHEG